MTSQTLDIQIEQLDRVALEDLLARFVVIAANRLDQLFLHARSREGALMALAPGLVTR